MLATTSIDGLDALRSVPVRANEKADHETNEEFHDAIIYK